MKVPELKETIAKAKKDEVVKVLVECYKAVAKAKKDELDEKIFSILGGQPAEKKKAAAPKVNLIQLCEDIDNFLSDAEDGNYFKPNREVSKGERSKWRHKVSNFFKILLSIPPTDDDAGAVADELYDLYRILCKATIFNIFRTQDPFPAIGWEQPELFAEIAKFSFAINGDDDEDFKKLIDIAVNDGCGREYLPTSQYVKILKDNILGSEYYDKALDELEKLRELYAKETQIYFKSWYISQFGYSPARRLEVASRFIFDINILKGNITGGFDRLEKELADARDNSEVSLYIALHSNFVYNNSEIWVKIYKHAVSKGIKPRESLVEDFKKRKSELKMK